MLNAYTSFFTLNIYICTISKITAHKFYKNILWFIIINFVKNNLYAMRSTQINRSTCAFTSLPMALLHPERLHLLDQPSPVMILCSFIPILDWFSSSKSLWILSLYLYRGWCSSSRGSSSRRSILVHLVDWSSRAVTFKFYVCQLVGLKTKMSVHEFCSGVNEVMYHLCLNK